MQKKRKKCGETFYFEQKNGRKREICTREKRDLYTAENGFYGERISFVGVYSPLLPGERISLLGCIPLIFPVYKSPFLTLYINR